MDFYTPYVKAAPKNKSRPAVVGVSFNPLNADDLVVTNTRSGDTRGVYFYNGSTWINDELALKRQISSDIHDRFDIERENYEELSIDSLDNAASKATHDWLLMKEQVQTEARPFDNKIFFRSDIATRSDFSTFHLSYDPTPMETPAITEIFSTLFTEPERSKLYWFLGAALTNSMPDIQKFIYLHGPKGSGKGTTIDIARALFEGYAHDINLQKLTSGESFSSEQVRAVPVLIDDETDLYRMKSDINLLKLISHDPIRVNKKYQMETDITFTGLLIAASNQAVKVRNVDSGITRRLVDINQTSNKIEYTRYLELMRKVPSEIPGFAFELIDFYNNTDPDQYLNYESQQMITETNYIHRFIAENINELLEFSPLTSQKAYDIYVSYTENDNAGFTLSRHEFRTEMERYFDISPTSKRISMNGRQYTSIMTNFNWDRLKESTITGRNNPHALPTFDSLYNIFEHSLYKGQLANADGHPNYKWDATTTIASNISQEETHFILPKDPDNTLIAIDIDHDTFEASYESYRTFISRYPDLANTYSELSRNPNRIHIYAWYRGQLDANSVEKELGPNIELKVYSGNQSLRRKFTFSNGVSTIGEIPADLIKRKETNPMIDITQLADEKHLRSLIEKNLKKEIHGATAPSFDFIRKLIFDAYDSGLSYDITDLRQDIINFAGSSTNQSERLLKSVVKLPFVSKDLQSPDDVATNDISLEVPEISDLYFVDVEVFLDHWILSYKPFTSDVVTTIVDPTMPALEELSTHPLVGFNNYGYDDYILYYALLGYSAPKLYEVSQKIITGFGEVKLPFKAHKVFYADIYDFSTKKQSLKRWELELGIPHAEANIDWNAPLPEAALDDIIFYNKNDVKATQKVFEANLPDYETRQMLSSISGLPVSSKGNAHAIAIIFAPDSPDNKKLVYSDLSETFPGYTFNKFNTPKSLYEINNSLYEPSEGGYVFTKPGYYEKVIELDVASMHPSSAIALNYFGTYTANYKAIKDARIEIKHGNFDKAKDILPSIKDFEISESNSKAIANALKLVINSAYGLSSASFDNPLKAPKNLDNIIAKRGALFMITLKEHLEKKGFEVIHIKTDSIKLVMNKLDFDPEDYLSEVAEFGSQYSYDFEIADTYTDFYLLNKAVLAGTDSSNHTHAIGAELIEPYILKSLFTKEPFTPLDYSVIKETRAGEMWLGEQFIGKNGRFYPSREPDARALEWVRPGLDPMDPANRSFVTGTKGYQWKEFPEDPNYDQVHFLTKSLNVDYWTTKAAKTKKKLEELKSEAPQ
jgi:hypothetical protein